MHPRNRSPGNGYRANAMGMGGVATASRSSPESSMRGRGGYNFEHRGYSRGGFGRGQSRQFHRSQPPPPPPKKGGGDIFMEAGRLAAEYLVSKGLLPANVLSGKWQNGNLKNQAGAQEGDDVQLSLEGRTSALSRLGGAVSDSGPGRRRSTEDYNSRSSLRGRRRSGSFKNYSSDWSRDFGKSGPWAERSRASMDGENDSDVIPRHRDEQQVSNDGDSVSQNSITDFAPESDAAGAKECGIVGDTQSASEDYEWRDNAGAQASASTSTKDLLLKTGEGVDSMEKDTKVTSKEEDEFKDGQINDEMEVQNTENDTRIMASSGVGGLMSEKNGYLLKFSRFAKVPTRTRSSMVVRGSKADHTRVIADENSYEGPAKESGAHARSLTLDNLSGDALSEHMYDSKALNLDKSTVSAPEDELGLSYSRAQGSCTAPVSFLDRTSVKEREQPDFEGIDRIIMEHGEKRALQDGLTNLGSKKPRECASFEDAESDRGLSMLETLNKPQTLEEPMTSEDQAVIVPPDDKRLLGISLIPKGDIEPCMEYAEEKQLFPGSFKTCDLNLMEASDASENHDPNPALIFPSNLEKGKQAIPVDIDLSMGNNPRVSDRYGKCIVDGKDIEVIDLDNDSGQEDKDSNNTDRRTENVFTGLGGFPNNAVNVNDIPDVQDGYGLMISELLGNDIPNCTSVPTDMNPLHNDMGLHNGEGILGDDDSIYMSLEEIPISFLRGWDQQTQEYGKPF